MAAENEEEDENDPNYYWGTHVSALDETDGTLKYTINIPHKIEFPLFIDDENDILHVFTSRSGILYQYSAETGEPHDGDDPEKGTFGEPCEGWPVFDGRDNIYFGFGPQGGLGKLDLKTHEVETLHSLDGRRIMAAITICSNKNHAHEPNYEPFTSLYFGTNTHMMKFDVIEKKIVWEWALPSLEVPTEFDDFSMPGFAAPVIDNWGKVLFGYVTNS